MAQILISGLAFAMSIASLSAQSNPSSPQRSLPKKDKQAVVANSATQVSLPVPQAVAPPALEPPQKPLTQPVIAWDGKLLTIDAENSTLSDILLGIRAHTGASIEMPPNASSERVAVHLGPSPVREVLSSLLYGTDFDYIIQASDTDPDGLRAVILTLREKEGKDKDKDDVVAGDPNNHRLMKGYGAPGKRDFQVAHESAEETATAQSDSATDAAASTQPVAADSGATAQNSTTPDNPSNPAPSAAPSESADAGLAIGQRVSPTQAALLSAGQAGSGEGSSISQMEQNLQRMYEQRKQIQAQQNQGAATGTTP